MNASNDYEVAFKRVYEPADAKDGARTLVDRLWPRGKRREDLQLTDWYRDASPSPALRRDWHKRQIDWEQFRQSYRDELAANPDVLTPLMRSARKGRLTLLTAARHPDQSHLPILREALLEQLALEDRQAQGGDPASPPCFDQ